MKKRKIPQRMCIGCRTKANKRDLIRIVRTPEEDIVFDPTGKKPGRGAYLCGQNTCLEKALKSKALENALNCTISDEVKDKLRESLVE